MEKADELIKLRRNGVIMRELGFKFHESQIADLHYGDFGKKGDTERVDYYNNETHRIGYWTVREKWNIKEIATTKTSMIISFGGIMYHYYNDIK